MCIRDSYILYCHAIAMLFGTKRKFLPPFPLHIVHTTAEIHLVDLWIHKYFTDDSSVNFHGKFILHFLPNYSKKWRKNRSWKFVDESSIKYLHIRRWIRWIWPTKEHMKTKYIIMGEWFKNMNISILQSLWMWNRNVCVGRKWKVVNGVLRKYNFFCVYDSQRRKV